MFDYTSIANSLITNYKWDQQNITYSFKTGKLSYEPNEYHEGFRQLYDYEKDVVRDVLNYIETFVNVTFEEVTTTGDMVFSTKTMEEDVLGYSYYPVEGDPSSGDVYLSSSFTSNDYQKGGVAYVTLLHELGHALGLQHPNDNGTDPSANFATTLMSYNPYTNEGKNIYPNKYLTDFTLTYQASDIVALQQVYGKNPETPSQGDNTYTSTDILVSSLPEGSYGQARDMLATIYDEAGEDTLDFSSIFAYNTYDNYINLMSGEQSILWYGDLRYFLNTTPSTNIENLILPQTNNAIILNSSDNTITGSNGIDTVYICANNAQFSHNGLSISIDSWGDTITPTIIAQSGETTIIRSTQGTDKLTNVENIIINNETLDLSNYQSEIIHSELSMSQSVARLYIALLDRLPDKIGFEYWLNDINSGQTLSQMSKSFNESVEFKQLYGTNLSNSEYIDLVYQNTLDRTPDTAGKEYWLNEMDNGMSSWDMIISFSESKEFIELNTTFTDNGIWVTS